MLSHHTDTTATIGIYIITFPFSEEEEPKISKPPVQDTAASLQLRFEEKSDSGITQEFADTQQQRLAFPTYSEEDILNWEVTIRVPPPRPSGTIRVKLKYKGRSKPIPMENPWE